MSFWQGAGARGEGRERGTKAVDLSKGPERIGIHHHEQGTTFPSKGVSFLFFLSLSK
jgi:hypothetical protein